MTIFYKNQIEILRFWDFEIFEILRHDFIGYNLSFNISISYLPSKKNPIPFVISQIYRNFAAYWYAERRASNPYANHPAMTTFPVASPLPTNKTKLRLQMRLHTAEIRPDDMFLD